MKDDQHRAQGASVAEALARAGATRLRPILMTTAAMVPVVYSAVEALKERLAARRRRGRPAAALTPTPRLRPSDQSP